MLIVMPLSMTAQNKTESFDVFRKSILDNYNNCRSEILSQYGKYLDSLWVEYPQYAGVVRNPFPKPKDIPVVKNTNSNPINEVPPTQDKIPSVDGTPSQPQTDPLLFQGKNRITILFYGIPLSMPDFDYNIPDNLSRSTVSTLWKYMSKGSLGQSIIEAIEILAKDLNLNDYLIFELTKNYVNTKFCNHTSFSRDALKHFLLSNMGYDVRLAETESGKSLILLPFNQMVYARSFLNIDDKKYFVFSDTPLNQNESVYTCSLPSDLFLGNNFELKLNELNLPYKPYKYEIKYGGITLTGEVNENIYPILYHYPQMPIGDYAQSVVSCDMRRNIVHQLKNALANESLRNKVEQLLHFTQYAFDYATDVAYHGFEKPYFLEEIMYYPKCDCEDRAIFYSYLLYNVVGIENHIISYPGHEATSLTLPSEGLKGTSYNYDGKTFYISDPTYMGASTGMCMPDFEAVTPKIDYIYK
jgi:hypothetical protein